VKNNVQPVIASRDRSYEYAREKRRRAAARRTRACLWCLRVFTTCHDTTRWCSHRCRQRGYLAPKTWALITWRDVPHHAPEAGWTFHPTRAAAEAAAPVGVPWTVVDITRAPWIEFPSMIGLLRRGRYVEQDVSPYP
jgi:hypothetical protein